MTSNSTQPEQQSGRNVLFGILAFMFGVFFIIWIISLFL